MGIKVKTASISSIIVIELTDHPNRLLQEILSKVKEAKYFGLIVDLAPLISHVVDLAIVLHYVH